MSFHSQAMKEAFLARLDRAKQRLFPEGGTVDNYRPFTGLLDALDGRVAGDVAQRNHWQYQSHFWRFLRLVCMKIFLLFLPLDYNFCVVLVRY